MSAACSASVRNCRHRRFGFGGATGASQFHVQEIMTAHGGELIVTSSAGKGTTMSLRFAEAAIA
jgi:signal transduction histidine kinase